uniref:Carboxylic ester hydrolase n=1 Tax=Glossina morsitans morsitans TaxID=37546 RepID=A0A1B0G120_GLOMM
MHSNFVPKERSGPENCKLFFNKTMVYPWLVLSLWVGLCRSQATIEVNTDLGKIKGLEMTSRLGEKFWSFRGIPYAQPPIGDLRFQPPQPYNAWKPQVYDATSDGPICPQLTTETSEISEDCLRLNVYTKNLNDKKPVIVYLHPGGFYSFSAQSKSLAGPQSFMDRDIVLVTVNYRLGSLGFLATGTAEAPGNAGLKDQVVALRWVQQHIRKFGGDCDSVTLWGYSAGSFSIGLHIMSPMSKGLFHRAIMMSASPLGQFNYQNNQLNLAEKQARLLDCPEKPIKNMVKCLKTKSTMDYVDTIRDMFEFEWNPVLNWVPVIEPNFGQERFLTDDPYRVMENTLRNETQRERFNADFATYAPIYFLYERETQKSLTASKAFREKYFQNQPLVYPNSLEKFGQLYSDGLIGFEYYRYLHMIVKHVPVYTYMFNYKGRYSFFINPDTNQTYGAMHHDELLYLLHMPVLTPLFTKTDPENDVIERLTRLWSEFAKNSNPNNPHDVYLKDIDWCLYTEKDKKYLEIGRRFCSKTPEMPSILPLVCT